MTSTILTLVIGLIGLFLLVARFAWLNSTLRDRAELLLEMTTGLGGNHINADFDIIRRAWERTLSQQRSFGGDAERIRHNRCPSAPLSMRERWVLCALHPIDHVAPKLADIASKLGLKPELVSLIARTLAATGYAKLVYLAAEQGEAAGRGYVLTDEGVKAKAAILATYENRSTQRAAQLSQGVAVKRDHEAGAIRAPGMANA